jgi:hypothetical protein
MMDDPFFAETEEETHPGRIAFWIIGMVLFWIGATWFACPMLFQAVWQWVRR